MDTLIFLAILASLLALWADRRGLGVALFFVALAATLLVFYSHLTSPLKLSF